jgi:hypothetical protein
MNRLFSVAMVGLLAVGLFAGCGKDPASEPSQDTSAATTSAMPTSPAPNTEGISQAATDFVDAVLKGDKDRAMARLTPKSVEKIVASGMHFSPPGEKGATFRIGQVHMRTSSEAVVPFVVSDEQMCCVLKLIKQDWRVSGLAYRAGPNRPWISRDFETGQSLAIALPARRPGTAARQASAAGPRPSPPRTGQQPPAGVIR